MGKPVSAHKKPLAEEDVDTVREDYVKRMRDNYPLIVRTLMHDIIVSVDKDGDFVFVNDSATEFFGKTSEKLIGSNFSEYVHPDDLNKATSALQEIMRGKDITKDFIIRVKSPRGIRTLAMNGIAVFDDEGNFIGAHATGKDLTELLQTEEELKWSRSHFQRLFEVIVDPIIIVDLTGNILELSQSAEEILGASREKLVGRQILETNITTAESKKVLKMNLEKLTKGMFIEPHIIEANTKDGKMVLYEASPARIMYRGQPAVLAIFRNITEQRKAEEKLQESEERFKHFLVNAPEAIWVQDIVGTFIDGNKKAEELTGYKREELVGKNLLELLVPPEAIPRIMEEFKANMFGELSGPVELEMIRKDGSLVSVEATTIPVEKDGKIEIIGITRDITERKKGEEALRESEARFRELSELLPEMVFETDLDGKVTFINQAVVEKSGYTQKDFDEGFPFLETLIPEDRKRAVKDMTNLLAKSVDLGFLEYTAVRKDGSTFPISLHVKPIIRDNQLVGTRGIVIDMTEPKKQEEALRESEKRFRELSELLPEVVFETDIAGRITFANQIAFDRFGYTQKDFDKGLDTFQMLIPEERDRAKEEIYEIFNGADIGFTEYTAIRKDGSTFPVMIHATPIIRGNKPVGLRGILVDITERKKQEELLRRAGEKFETYFDLAKVMLIAIDAEGNVVEINKEVCEVLGNTKEQILGKNWFSNFLPKRLEKKTKSYFKKLLSGQIDPVEYHANHVVTKAGKERLIEWHNILLRDEQGKIIGTLSSGQDITAQSEAEEKLRASEERFRSLIDNAPEAIWLQDAGGTFVDGNKRAEEITGYKKDELIGKNMLEANLLPDKSIPIVLEALSTIQIGERSDQTEIELIRKDGSLVSVETSAIPIERDGKIEVIGIAKDITERKKMEEALKASEERFRGTLDGMLEGCQIIDYHWRYVYVNDSAAKHGRLPKKELLGNTMMDVYPDIEKTKLFSVLSKCMKERVPAQIENEFTYPNDEKAWFELSIEPVPEGLFILSIDITDRKEVEEALRREQEMLEMVTGNINAGLVVVSKDYVVLWANNVIKKYVGDIEGKPCYSVINQRDDVCVGCGVKEIFETGQDWVVHEQVIQTPDDQETWLLITTTAIRDEKGEIVAASEMSWDITERKQAEKELIRLSTAVKMSKDSIIITDNDGTIVDVNEAGLKMYNVANKKDLIGKNSVELIVPEKREEAIANMKEAMEQGNLPTQEYILVTNYKKQITVESSTAIMNDASGKPIGFVSISRDITDRKKAEEELKELNNLLKRSNKELESYTYVVSHDLKAPLRTVRSFGSFILEDYKDKLDETGQDYLNRMIRASSHLDQMIEDLLILSRVGRKFTEIKEVDLNKLLEEILSDLEATIKEHKTKVVVDKLPVLSAQKVWMRQLFMNLIGNALKFNESKRPKIEVLYEESDKQHLFKVRDNGIGIEEKYLERIFKLFERAPTEKKYDGTGAGLSICKKIVEHYGGKIWVESTLGKGSTFMFNIPKRAEGTRK